MIDQLIGLIMVGLGLTTPSTAPTVLGEKTEVKNQELKSSLNENLKEVKNQIDQTLKQAREDQKAQEDANKSRLDALKTETKAKLDANRQAEKSIQPTAKALMEDAREKAKSIISNASSPEMAKQELNELKRVTEEKMQAFKESHEAFLQEQQQIREETQAKMAQIKTEMEQKRETFQTQIAQIKDTAKKNAATRVAEGLTTANSNRIASAEKQLSQFSDLLTELSKNTSADQADVMAAIQAAQASLLQAQNSVADQKTKDYTVSVPEDPAALRSVFETAKSQFTTDWKVVKNVLASARKAIGDVNRLVEHAPAATGGSN